MIASIETLKQKLDIPRSIREAATISEAEFRSKLDDLADQAFDDQCTGANPRYPLIEDLKQLLLNAYYGEPVVDPDTPPLKALGNLESDEIIYHF